MTGAVVATLQSEAMSKYGAPSSTNITFTIAESGSIDIDVQYQKRPTRMAESIWMSFRPIVHDPHAWRLDKLGRLIDPFQVVVNGSKAMHAVWEGLTYNTTALSIASLDAPIVTVDTPSPIVFLKEQQIEADSFHFNLFNNAWNVNYPVWEVNPTERFRFALKFGASLST